MKKIWLLFFFVSLAGAQTSSSKRWSGNFFGGYCLQSATGAVTHPAIIPIDEMSGYPQSGAPCVAADLTWKNRYRFALGWLPAKYVGTDEPVSSTVYPTHYDLGLGLNFGKPDRWTLYLGGNFRLLHFKVEDYAAGVLVSTVGVDHKMLFPMIDVGTELRLFKSFSLTASVKVYFGGDDSLTDYNGAAKLKLYRAFTVLAGYRQIKFKYNRNSLVTDLTLAGPYFQAGLQF